MFYESFDVFYSGLIKW